MIPEIVNKEPVKVMAAKAKVMKAADPGKVKNKEDLPSKRARVKVRKEGIMLLHHLPLRLLLPIQEELQNREFEAVKV
jgi:hypothetical protein